MTIREVISAMARRWYVVVGVFAVAGSVLYLFAGAGGTYSTRTVISFTWPDLTLLMAENGNTDAGVIAFAGAVATEVNNGRAPQTYNEVDAPYFGAGIREGYVVALRDNGNQWYNDFSRAQIDIQIVGRTYDWVADTQDRLVAAVFAAAEARQSSVSVPEAERVTMSVIPLTQAIGYVSPGRTSLIIGVGAMMLAAAIVSAWAAVAVDRRRSGQTRGALRPRTPTGKDVIA